MTIRDELGIPIAAIVDDGFLHTAKTGSRVGADVLETQRFDHINHVVRTATVGRQDLDFAWSSGRLLLCWSRGSLFGSRSGRSNNRSRASQHPALEKFPPFHTSFLRRVILPLQLR